MSLRFTSSCSVAPVASAVSLRSYVRASLSSGVRWVMLAALGVLVCTSSASAAYMDCLEEAKGKSIVWNSAWSAPTGDQDVQYSISSVRVRNVMPERSVTLELSTEQNAVTKRRTLVVETEERARSVCERIVVYTRPLSLPGEAQSRMGTASAGDPDFIQYSRDGWVRAKYPRTPKRMTKCKIQGKEYSCLEEDKDRFGTALLLVEEELNLGMK